MNDEQIDRICEFLWFIAEREKIRHRRFDLAQPPPWTDDPILRDNVFCNIYREEDRGTRWAIENIIVPNKGNDCNLVFQIVAYRSINRIETIDHVGLPDWESFDADLFCQRLREVRRKKDPITGRAYRIHSIQGKTREETCTFMIATAHQNIELRTLGLKTASSLEQAWTILRALPNVGRFLGFEICLDLNYSETFWPDFSEDDFVFVGPGAEDGVQAIWPEARTQEQQVERLRWLTDHQADFLPDDYPGKRITLANMEQAMCEWRKYFTLQAGGRGPRRRFRPKSA
jgi:hypothetical protein